MEKILQIMLTIILFGGSFSVIMGFILAMLIAAYSLAIGPGISDMKIFTNIFYICWAISFCVISYFIYKILK